MSSSATAAAATAAWTGGQPLEQFLLLAKSARGAAVVALIEQALESPLLFVYGDLLEMPSVLELRGSENAKYFDLLQLFAYGTLADYRKNQLQLPTLTPLQLNKLKQLTLISLAGQSKTISYEVLLTELEISSLRELEDLIIEAIYADIIRGKLDQKNSQLEVDFAIGRDIKENEVGDLVSVLQQWSDGCENVLATIEDQVRKANKAMEESDKMKKKINDEVDNLKKALSAQAEMTSDSSKSFGAKKSGKNGKAKKVN
ncbi:COP9 signalosome complex subunit 7b-like isoform X2 [Oscarella lobularis]|uniref:COP9 signalosome complex subunit 7b-like isoform X2 n=1 Tax=Oscarella lobularis TaxID=121494 RepID=UPI003313A92E